MSPNNKECQQTNKNTHTTKEDTNSSANEGLLENDQQRSFIIEEKFLPIELLLLC